MVAIYNFGSVFRNFFCFVIYKDPKEYKNKIFELAEYSANYQESAKEQNRYYFFYCGSDDVR